jgi:hypothetical protein
MWLIIIQALKYLLQTEPSDKMSDNCKFELEISLNDTN